MQFNDIMDIWYAIDSALMVGVFVVGAFLVGALKTDAFMADAFMHGRRSHADAHMTGAFMVGALMHGGRSHAGARMAGKLILGSHGGLWWALSWMYTVGLLHANNKRDVPLVSDMSVCFLCECINMCVCPYNNLLVNAHVYKISLHDYACGCIECACACAIVCPCDCVCVTECTYMYVCACVCMCECVCD